MQKQAAYVYMVFTTQHHMALVGLWHIKEELAKGFLNFQISFQALKQKGAKIISSKPYLKHQLLG